MIMLIYPLGDTGGAERFGTGNARIKNFLRFLLSIFDPCSSIERIHARIVLFEISQRVASRAWPSRPPPPL